MLNVIVNQQARRVKKLVAKTEERLTAAGVAYRVFYTDKPGAAMKYARSLSAAGGTEFLVVGGDGTVNEVLSGLTDPAACTLASSVMSAVTCRTSPAPPLSCRENS